MKDFICCDYIKSCASMENITNVVSSFCWFQSPCSNISDASCVFSDIDTFFMSGICHNVAILILNLVFLPFSIGIIVLYPVMASLKGRIKKFLGSYENLSSRNDTQPKKQNPAAVPSSQFFIKTISDSSIKPKTTEMFTIGQSGNLAPQNGSNVKPKLASSSSFKPKRNDKHGKILREIREEEGELIDINTDMKEGADNVNIALEACEIEAEATEQKFPVVMGVQAKQLFTHKIVPSFAAQVHPATDNVTVEKPEIGRPLSLSHLRFQNPLPYFRQPDTTFQNQIKNFHFINKSTNIQPSELHRKENNSSGIQEPPIPKPRTSLLQKREMTTKFKKPLPKPRNIKPFQWADENLKANFHSEAITGQVDNDTDDSGVKNTSSDNSSNEDDDNDVHYETGSFCIFPDRPVYNECEDRLSAHFVAAV